jgi:hypothetical protein
MSCSVATGGRGRAGTAGWISAVNFLSEFAAHLPASLRRKFRGLHSPFALQAYLDGMPYIAEERDRSPLQVMQDGQCHCLDGGFLAALALWQIGFKPLLIDLVPAPGLDDDHVLALYQVAGRWGAVAKSNYVNLGFREPVYRNLRELVMSYFEHYASIHRQKTLRGYTRPFDASRFTRLNWAWDEVGANRLYKLHFYGRKAMPLVSTGLARRLHLLTDRAYAAETMFTDLNESFGNRPGH